MLAECWGGDGDLRVKWRGGDGASGGEETAICESRGRVEPTIERLRALQQAQEAVIDAEKAAFDRLAAVGNSEPRWLQLLEESAGGGNADSGIQFVCERVTR